MALRMLSNSYDTLAVYSIIGQHQILYEHVTTSGSPMDIFKHFSDRKRSLQNSGKVPIGGVVETGN